MIPIFQFSSIKRHSRSTWTSNKEQPGDHHRRAGACMGASPCWNGLWLWKCISKPSETMVFVIHVLSIGRWQPHWYSSMNENLQDGVALNAFEPSDGMSCWGKYVISIHFEDTSTDVMFQYFYALYVLVTLLLIFSFFDISNLPFAQTLIITVIDCYLFRVGHLLLVYRFLVCS